MKLKLKILKKGDRIVNVFNHGEGFAVAVKRKAGHVDVILVIKNKNGVPEISETITICEGSDEVQFGDKNVMISTF